jgi:hypothetical protein
MNDNILDQNHVGVIVFQAVSISNKVNLLEEKKRNYLIIKLTVRYFSPIELRNGTLSSAKHLKNCRTLIK